MKTTKSCQDCFWKLVIVFLSPFKRLDHSTVFITLNNNISLNVYFTKLLDLYEILLLFLTNKNFMGKLNDNAYYDCEENVTFSSISIKIFTGPLLHDCLVAINI